MSRHTQDYDHQEATVAPPGIEAKEVELGELKQISLESIANSEAENMDDAEGIADTSSYVSTFDDSNTSDFMYSTDEGESLVDYIGVKIPQGALKLLPGPKKDTPVSKQESEHQTLPSVGIEGNSREVSMKSTDNSPYTSGNERVGGKTVIVLGTSQAHLIKLRAKKRNAERMAQKSSMNGTAAFWPFLGSMGHNSNNGSASFAQTNNPKASKRARSTSPSSNAAAIDVHYKSYYTHEEEAWDIGNDKIDEYTAIVKKYFVPVVSPLLIAFACGFLVDLLVLAPSSTGTVSMSTSEAREAFKQRLFVSNASDYQQFGDIMGE